MKPVSIKWFSTEWLFLVRLSVDRLSLAGIDTPATVDLPAADDSQVNVKASVASFLVTDFDGTPILLEWHNV